MSGRGVSLALKAATAILPTALFASSAGAATYKVLYSFPGKQQVSVTPRLGLIMDKNGNLYGTTGNIQSNDGTVFELSPGPDGTWTETVLHTFAGKDGLVPSGGLIQDASGNLYGTTQYGGENYGVGASIGDGVVFELSPASGGAWTETVLHSFSDSHTDGGGPLTGVVIDGAGNLYGTTPNGGSHNSGVVYELTPTSGGTWTEAVLYTFAKPSPGPQAIVVDAAGNLYGTTSVGGPPGQGTAFELTPSGGGAWTKTGLHNFGTAPDGIQPDSGLAFDGSGNLYGETYYGGTHDDGTVFELKPQSGAGGVWTEEVLHSFHAEATGGISPVGGLIFDGKGNFYGTTSQGGADQYGELFEFMPKEGGGWEHTVLHDFDASSGQGAR